MNIIYYVLIEHDFFILDVQDFSVSEKRDFALPCRIEAYSSSEASACEDACVNCCYVFEEYNDFFNFCMNRIKKIIHYLEFRRGSEDYAFCYLAIKKYLDAIHCLKK